MTASANPSTAIPSTYQYTTLSIYTTYNTLLAMKDAPSWTLPCVRPARHQTSCGPLGPPSGSRKVVQTPTECDPTPRPRCFRIISTDVPGFSFVAHCTIFRFLHVGELNLEVDVGEFFVKSMSAEPHQR